MIFVLDSGVWISALQFKGTPLAVVDQILTRYEVAICEPIRREIHDALTGKFRWSEERFCQAFQPISAIAFEINISGNLRGVCRDPKDDMVFECALLAGADFIISGDKDLLAVEDYRGIKVLTPRAFVDKFLATSPP